MATRENTVASSFTQFLNSFRASSQSKYFLSTNPFALPFASAHLNNKGPWFDVPIEVGTCSGVKVSSRYSLSNPINEEHRGNIATGAKRT